VVDDGAGAGGFAGSAIEAEIEMFADGIGGLDDAFCESSHELDSAPGGIGFVESLGVSGAGGKAEATMNAGEGAVVRARVKGERCGFARGG